MLERFKDFDFIGIKWETFEEKDFLVDYLKKQGFKCKTPIFNLGQTILGVDFKEKTFGAIDCINILPHDEDNVAYIHTKDIITLDMKKQIYLTKEQLECIDYVDEELEEVEVMDLYYDKEKLIVKARYIWSLEEFELELENFFLRDVSKIIEDDFYECMTMDWDSLDNQYKMLALSRKCMKELI